MVANKAYLQGLHRSGSNRFGFIGFIGFLFHGMVELQPKVPFFWSSPVSVWPFSGSMDWTFNPYCLQPWELDLLDTGCGFCKTHGPYSLRDGFLLTRVFNKKDYYSTMK